jgi:hypothetical protein
VGQTYVVPLAPISNCLSRIVDEFTREALTIECRPTIDADETVAIPAAANPRCGQQCDEARLAPDPFASFIR